MPKKITPIISIIIPTLNEEKNLLRCLKSIKKLTAKTETIIVDNYSQDRTLEIAKKFKTQSYQKGFERSQQRNFGAQKAKGKYLIFLDADMTINNSIIAEGLKVFSEGSSLNALIIPEISQGSNYWAKVKALERQCYLYDPLITAPRFFRKSAFIKADGFDEKLLAGEDWDLGLRIGKLRKTGQLKTPLIHHEDKLSLLSHLKKKYYYIKSIKLFQNKYPKEFHQFSGFNRIKIFLKHYHLLITKPFLTVGLIIMKSLEYFMFLIIQLLTT